MTHAQRAPDIQLGAGALRRLAAALWVAAAGCGGGGDGPSGPGTNSGDSHMTARIDGVQWASTSVGGGNDVATLVFSGSYLVQGQRIAGGTSSAISMNLYNIRGPGTYPMGMSLSAIGGTGVVAESGRGWLTPLSGAAGTVTITTLTSDRIAGTFAFNAEASNGGATGSKAVTDGRFDFPIRVNGNVGPLPENAGSRIAATIGGSPWNGSTIVAASASASTFILTASNTSYTLTMQIAGMTAPGAYPLAGNPGRSITVMGPGVNPQGQNCCWGGSAGTSGTVTITSVTSARVVGTFNATLSPTPGTQATGTLVITNGTFDVGRQ